jgi:hypothetical protein
MSLEQGQTSPLLGTLDNLAEVANDWRAVPIRDNQAQRLQ